MVEVFRFKNLKFKINSNDHPPPHVHIYGAGAVAKIDISSLRVISSKGFSDKDLKILQQQVFLRKLKLIEKWNNIHEKN